MRDELRTLTPRLRRYARALVAGSADNSDLADSLVQATLMRALGARGIDQPSELAIRLFATVTQLHRDLEPLERSAAMAGGGVRRGAPTLVTVRTASRPDDRSPGDQLAAALMRLSLEEREALLLVTLEGFDYAAASRILRVSRSVLIDRLTCARTALGRLMETSRPVTPAVRRRAPHLRLVVG